MREGFTQQYARRSTHLDTEATSALCSGNGPEVEEDVPSQIDKNKSRRWRII
jgi:hypothetical protein